jgi:hypothetical protein
MRSFMICTPHQILFVYLKENEASEAYCMKRREMDTGLQREILIDREHLEGLHVDGSIILKQTLKKYDGYWTGLIWVRAGTSGGPFRTW